MKPITIDTEGNWRLYWGPGPLPEGAQARGTVQRGIEVGALIEHATGIYTQGNYGVLRPLPQAIIRRALNPAPRPVAEAARALGRMARGVPKRLTAEDRARRAELAREMTRRRKACACGKPVGEGVGDGICIECRFDGRG